MTIDPAQAGPPIGSEFAGHRIEAVLGRGGMGIVYRATNVALDRVRALKVLAPALSADERFRERFRRESRLAASIEHPNVIPVHQAGDEDGHLFLSMRLVEGRDLRETIVADGPLDPPLAAEIVRGVASGLDAAHQAGLIHRDVKPANVLVGDGADAGRVYLTDFGISRAVGGGETVTSTGELVGTADFIAPEQIAGDPVDHRADVYALGGVLYFVLTGRSPFPRENELATLFAHANAPRPRPSEARADLPAGIDAVVARAMAIDPDHRYWSAGELASAVDAALGGEAVAPPPGPPDDGRPSGDEAETRRLPTGAARRRGRWAAGLAALALAAGVVIFLLVRDSETADAPPVTVSTPVDVGAAPTALDVGPSRVWVAANEGDKVNGVDLISSEVTFNIPVAAPKAVAVGHDSVWVVSEQTDSLYRLDPLEDREQRFQLPEGSNPVDVATDSEWVWVAEEGTNNLLRFDPETNTPSATAALGLQPRSVAVGEGSVWVTNIHDNSVSQVDPTEHKRVGLLIDVDELPNDLTVGEGAVWVTSNVQGTVTRIEPGTRPRAGDPIDVGAQPRGIDAGLGYVWVALGGEDSVVRVDPGTADVVGDPIPVGDNPSDVSVGEDAVWVASEGPSTITRIEP